MPGRSAAPPPFRLVAAAPGFASQRLWFYVDPGLPEVVTGPHRGKLAPAFWPVLYTDTWGDFFGNWTWGATQQPMTESIENRLTVQSIVGILPTFLAAVGLLALAGLAALRVRTRPELLPVALLPLAALAGTLYYAYSYPSTDGDTVKALFILPGISAIAVCFGFAVETLGRRSRPLAVALAVVLAVCFCGLDRVRDRMSAEPDRIEWLLVRGGLVVVAVTMVAVGAAGRCATPAKAPLRRGSS